MKPGATATAVVLLAVLAAGSLPAEEESPTAERRVVAERIGRVITTQLWDEHQPPYLGLAVVYGDQTVLLARGYHDEQQTIAFDPHESVVRAASVGKLPTTLVAAELLREHRINSDEPVRDYTRLFTVPTHERTSIQFDHLFTHTEGFELRSVNTRTFDPDQLIPLRQYLNDTPPLTFQRPGMMITYGNWAGAVLGGVIEELTGRPFAEVVNQQLFGPAGMADSTFEQPLPPELAARRAPDYRYQGSRLRRLQPSWSQLVSADGLHSTVADAARLIELLQNNGKLDETRVLSQETVDRAFETQARVHPRLPGVTLGFLEEQHSGLRMLIRDGDSEGVMSRVILVPQADIGIFVVTGSNSAEPRAGAARLLGEELCSEIECPQPYTGYPQPAAEPLQVYAGLYSLANRPRHDVSRLPVQLATLLRVSMKNSDTIMVTPLTTDSFAGIDRPTEFRPMGDQLFEAVDRPARIAFARGPLGDVRYLHSGAGYHGSYEKLRPWERLYFALAGLVLPMLLCAIETLRRIAAAFRAKPVDLDGRARLQRIGLSVFAAAITVFAALLVPAIALLVMTPGLPAWVQGLGAFAYAVFTLPLIALVSVLGSLALGARSVPTGVAISVPEGIMDRLLLGSVPILFVALYHWRLLGYWF